MYLTQILQQYAPYAPVLPPQLQFGQALVFDLHSEQSPFYGINDLAQLIAITEQLMHDAGAVLGVGAYAEQRFMYQYYQQFEDRNIHLGLDLTAPAGTAVMTPLRATVHSIADHQQDGDYGPTVILQHQLESSIFYTLYGHLGHQCLHKLSVGQTLVAGEQFASIGTPLENGGWPPHLHLQIIEQLAEQQDTYPGVANLHNAHHLLANCPSPQLLLNLI